MSIPDKNRRYGFGRIGLILILPFVILTVAYGAYKLFFIPDPVVSGLEAFEFLPSSKTIQLSSENIRAIDITLYQEGKEFNLLKDTNELGEKIYSLEVKPQDIGLKDGRAIITVKAEASILKKVQYDIESVIDTQPPTLQVMTAPSTVIRGSGGFAEVRSSGESTVFIKLVDKGRPGKDTTFKAFKVSPDTDKKPDSSAKQTQSTYHTFFPAPFESGERTVFYAIATDRAGNQTIKALPTKLKDKKYKSSVIRIDDSFITRVISPLLNETEIPDPAGAFKKVNEEWREQSLIRLKSIAENTESRMLWKGRFGQLKNSKVMATYGDKRTYRYKGKSISKAVHLGYDLASFSRAPVRASNSGIVRFASNLSIYGNTVVIDHGLGLMSLYGHLSTISVSDGEKVTRGQIIGKTGSTGLAGGDHLHFGILMHGHEVSPLYWWDPNWIRINVTQ